MTYVLPSGSRVRVFDLGGGQKEFETRGPAGDVIATVRQSGAQAALTVNALEANAR